VRYLALLTVLFATAANSADTPTVSVEVSPESVTVGESIRLRVSVLGPTWFLQPPRFPSFEVTNAVVRLPPDSSFPLSQRVNGDTWTGVVRNYEVIPLIGGIFRMDGLVMQVTYADPETIKPVVMKLDVPPIAFTAVVPAGAEDLDPYIAGTGLQLRRELDGETDNLQAGDALVVQYSAELEGLPSMFIPDFVEMVDIAGVSVYTAEPRFSDDGVATRTEELTFVFEAGGEFTIPGVSLEWWNMATTTVESANLPAISVNVTGPPVTTPPAVQAQRELHPWRIAAILLLAVAAAWFLGRVLGITKKRRAERRQQELASEAYAFGQLQRALLSGDPRLGYQRLLGWVGRLEGVQDAASFAAEYGDETLQQGIRTLRAALYSEAVTEPDLQVLAASLGSANRSFHRDKRRAARALPPGLNP